MAYARWGDNSEYYIFWSEKRACKKTDQVLAVWHQASLPGPGAEFTYSQVLQMLANRDFARVPGFKPVDVTFLEPIFRQFVADVDAELGANHDDAGSRR